MMRAAAGTMAERAVRMRNSLSGIRPLARAAYAAAF